MNKQLDEQGRLKHFLSIEDLPRSLLTEVLDSAERFTPVGERAVKNVPLLRGKTVVNLFFEPSTRTRSTFELAAKRLSADIMNLNIEASATRKGESLSDTLKTLEAMQCDMFVVRHQNSGAAAYIADQVAAHISVINAGDGRHAHPTQAMLDMFTIRRVKQQFEGLVVAIIGDITHSRVARSEIQALKTLGVSEIRVVGPKTLIPRGIEALGAKVFHRMEAGIAGADVVIMLRLQQERMQSALLPSAQEYFQAYGLTEKRLRLAANRAMVMHPGPINRGVEIDSAVADGDQSVILQQVTHGIAIRMAVMSLVIGAQAMAGTPWVAAYCLKGARVIDPANDLDQVTNVFVDSGTVAAIGRAPRGFTADDTIDLRGQILTPGFIELGARLREPGYEHKATIASECKAAAAGGFTSVCCTPDTLPVVDNASVVEHIKQRAGRARAARVLCLGALTQGLEGNVLSEMRALKESGCVAVTNAHQAIRDTSVLRHALAYASTCELTVLLHPLDDWLANEGTMHEGAVSTRLGIPGIPEAQELIAISRDLILVEETGVRAHFCRLSSARSIALVARARRSGLPVSADVALPNLLFIDRDVGSYDANFHLRPPLREARDRSRLRAGIRKRDIDAICGNHEPHDADAKATPFGLAAPGISTFDTFLSALLSLVDQGAFDLSTAIESVTAAPSAILGLNSGRLTPGAPADICVFDPAREWEASGDALMSSGKNTPFLGQTMRGRTTMTLVEGRIVHQDTA